MTTTEPDSTFPAPPALEAFEPLPLRRNGSSLGRFVRRSPLAAFWGCIAAAILLMAIAAPVVAPYEPLKSDFRAMS